MNIFQNLKNQTKVANQLVFFRDTVVDSSVELLTVGSAVQQATRRKKSLYAKFVIEHQQPPAVTEQEERIIFEANNF